MSWRSKIKEYSNYRIGI